MGPKAEVELLNRGFRSSPNNGHSLPPEVPVSDLPLSASVRVGQQQPRSTGGRVMRALMRDGVIIKTSRRVLAHLMADRAPLLSDVRHISQALDKYFC